jgi:ribosomal protein S18 acetylase RimI-like enzyme
MRRATFADAADGEGAAALNRVFEHYLVPISFTTEQLQLHMSYNDVDSGASPIWLDDDGEVIAAGLLAIREKRGWIGGFGVSPEYRGKGFAKQLLAHMVDTARERSLASIALEVLKENTPAFALYRAGGFELVRELRSFECISEGAPMPRGFAYSAPDRFIDEPEPVRPSWQRERTALRQGAVSTAVTDEKGNYAAYRFNTHLAQVLKLNANSAEELIALARAVSADIPLQRVMVLNEPEDSPIAEYAVTAGWKEPFNQYEMILDLR